MATKATIFKADLQIADMDRDYYQTHGLTIARHPSETDERMMLRLLVFALNASETLTFTRGLSTDDEPDLWDISLSNEIMLWIELGQPDEKRLRRACGRAAQVMVYTYSGHGAEIWWDKIRPKLSRFENLAVNNLSPGVCSQLAGLVERTMELQCTVQDRLIWFSDGTENVSIELEAWK